MMENIRFGLREFVNSYLLYKYHIFYNSSIKSGHEKKI